jgi:hypothetical protein
VTPGPRRLPPDLWVALVLLACVAGSAAALLTLWPHSG